MNTIITLLLCALPLAAQTMGPFHSSIGRGKSDATNFATDLIGVQDTRLDTWGDAAATSWAIVFQPPAGYRVRILRLRGDLGASVKVLLPADTPVQNGQSAWTLISLQTTAPQGSSRCYPCADNTMLYHQLPIDQHPGHLVFDEDVSAAGLLQSDNTLMLTVAVFMNTTGKPVHIEPTLSGIAYRYEKIPVSGGAN